MSSDSEHHLVLNNQGKGDDPSFNEEISKVSATWSKFTCAYFKTLLHPSARTKRRKFELEQPLCNSSLWFSMYGDDVPRFDMNGPPPDWKGLPSPNTGAAKPGSEASLSLDERVCRLPHTNGLSFAAKTDHDLKEHLQKVHDYFQCPVCLKQFDKDFLLR